MKIILDGNPYSTNNIYYHKGHIAFIKARPKEQKENYAKEAFEQWQSDPISCDIKIEINLFFGDKRKRDWDNYHKLAMDALTGIVWNDDSQIKIATVKLGYDKEKPRIELDIYPVDNFNI